MQSRALLVALAAFAAALPASAQAAGALGSLPLALSAAASLEQGQCAGMALPAAGEARPAAPAMSKASAILGGQVSQLELMRRQQAQAPVVMTTPTLPGAGLVPRSGGECALFVRPQSDFAAMRPGRAVNPLGGEDFLASKRLAVSRTGFDAQWERVRKGKLAVAGLGSSPGRPTLAAINSWANARIRYVEDRQLYGKADYWADARTTLKRGAGDCEDIAVLKLALLAGAGVRREDIYLTVARDLARNADHALLVVKADGRFWLLDNNTDSLLEADKAYDYRPILSYGAKGKWLHGY